MQNAGYVATETALRLYEFLVQEREHHVSLSGPEGSGKSSTAHYVADRLTKENHCCLFASLRGVVGTFRGEIGIAIARATVAEADLLAHGSLTILLNEYDREEVKHLAELIASSPAHELNYKSVGNLIQMVLRRLPQNSRIYIFIDSLDEARYPYQCSVEILALVNAYPSLRLILLSRGRDLAYLRRYGSFEYFELQPLTHQEIENLLLPAKQDNSLSHSKIEKLVALSGGNPLILTLARELFIKESFGGLEELEGGWQTAPLETIIDRAFRAVFQGLEKTSSFRTEDLLRIFRVLAIIERAPVEKLAGLLAVNREVLQRLPGSLNIGLLAYDSKTSLLSFSHVVLFEYAVKHYANPGQFAVRDLQFGDEAAERDTLWARSFSKPASLAAILGGSKTIVLGDRGSGKSAIFRAFEEEKNRSVSEDNFRLDGSPPLILALSRSPADFVLQVTADVGSASSADGFRATWLLYSAALIAKELHPLLNQNSLSASELCKECVALLRRIGWKKEIKIESRFSQGANLLRALLPEKVSFTLGPVKLEKNWDNKPHLSFGSKDINIDRFLASADREMAAVGKRITVMFDQIDEIYKYQRDAQEKLLQGLLLAESALSLTQCIRLAVLLRTDLFDVYDIQEKNKFVSRTVHLEWDREALLLQLIGRSFSNEAFQKLVDGLGIELRDDRFANELRMRILFPDHIEGRPFENWLFESLKNGRSRIAPRQVILFLNLLKDDSDREESTTPLPIFGERPVAAAMSRLSEFCYQEIISDFRVAPAFVRNCRAGKLKEFRLETVTELFDLTEGTKALQIERLERLGFLERVVVQDGGVLVPKVRIPDLFTRSWNSGN